MDHQSLVNKPWPLWRRILFRFFCIFLILQIAPIKWLDLPGISYIIDYYFDLIDWLTESANTTLFHIRPTLVPVNGSGDTSFGWAELSLYLLLGGIGCIVWTIADRKRQHYNTADYWLRTLIRYHIILISFSYGFSKLFMLQMPYPTDNIMATPVGDLSPMRLAWVFIGYSGPYQAYAGIMEILVGLLLLYRRTITIGILLGLGVYLNVLMLNMGYDIPVKIFSASCVLYCLYLLVHQHKRLMAFFVYNRTALPDTSYEPPFIGKKMRMISILAKSGFILFFLVMAFITSAIQYNDNFSQETPEPFSGLYDVTAFSRGKDTVTNFTGYDMGWKNIVFSSNNKGSIATNDPAFMQRYGRGYFAYEIDKANKIITLKETIEDTAAICQLYYTVLNNDKIAVRTKIDEDSIYMELMKSPHHYRLKEKKFNWLNEQVP